MLQQALSTMAFGASCQQNTFILLLRTTLGQTCCLLAFFLVCTVAWWVGWTRLFGTLVHGNCLHTLQKLRLHV